MKAAAFALLALVALVAGYFFTGRALRHCADLPDDRAKIEWLRKEFALGPEACARIEKLQADYEPVCAKHCASIAKTGAALRAAGENPEARAAAEAELARLRNECAQATRAHLEAVAAQMPSGEGARFLAMMEPRVTHADDRVGAPALAPATGR